MTAGSPDFQFRPLVEGDLPAVLAIENRAFPVPWSHEQFLGELSRRRIGWNRVMEPAGRPPVGGSGIVAYACAWVVRDEMQINRLAVEPDLAGRGLGSRLLGRLLEEARRRNCTEVSLEVAFSNRVARKMYRSAGFREGGVRPGYYGQPGENALVLRCFLGPGPVPDL